MKITESLKIEHQLLRNMMVAMSRWLNESVEPDKLRERAVMLEAALNIHSAREERQLFAPLSAYSDIARDLVSMIEKVHAEVRSLFEQVADPGRNPTELLWEILRLTDEHFTEEETGLFPLAEKLLQAECLVDHSLLGFYALERGPMKITEALEIEHELLRNMIEVMSQWLTESVAPDKLRERAVMLEIAIDDHAAREEQQVFVPLAVCSNSARELVNLMEIVHTEVRELFDQVANPARDPKEQLWTILMLTTEHFTKEETGVFPMAERLLSAEALEVHNP